MRNSFISFCLLIIISGCSATTKVSDQELFRVAMIPQGAISWTYFVTVSESGKMSVLLGTREPKYYLSEHIYKKNYMLRDTTKKEKQLNEEELQRLKGWLDEISDYENIIRDWSVLHPDHYIIGYNGKTYGFNGWSFSTEIKLDLSSLDENDMRIELTEDQVIPFEELFSELKDHLKEEINELEILWG